MGHRFKIGIVAALQREIKPLIRDWKVEEIFANGCKHRVFSDQNAVLICAGIGCAGPATKVLIEQFDPEVVISVGFAGALDASLRVPDVFIPAQITEAKTGVAFDTGLGSGRLLTTGRIADIRTKQELALRFKAQAVDMEASQVAEVAEARRRRFLAIKVISDNLDSDIEFLSDFVENGGFNTAGFITYVAVRPRLWGAVRELQINSNRAQKALCDYLTSIVKNPNELEFSSSSAAVRGVVTPAK